MHQVVERQGDNCTFCGTQLVWLRWEEGADRPVFKVLTTCERCGLSHLNIAETGKGMGFDIALILDHEDYFKHNPALALCYLSVWRTVFEDTEGLNDPTLIQYVLTYLDVSPERTTATIQVSNRVTQVYVEMTYDEIAGQMGSVVVRVNTRNQALSIQGQKMFTVPGAHYIVASFQGDVVAPTVLAVLCERLSDLNFRPVMEVHSE